MTTTTTATAPPAPPPPPLRGWTCADLFSGIGAFRLGFESLGGRCVFSCEIDDKARRVYQDNFAREGGGGQEEGTHPPSNI